jgi:hypothetical protein
MSDPRIALYLQRILMVREGIMTASFNLSRAASSEVLNQLRALRASIAQARDALMHFHHDRLDRDKLEPAARRIDMLMNMFAGELRDPARGALLVTEIQNEVDQVTNPKAAEALRDARVDITTLLDVMRADATDQCPEPDGGQAVPSLRTPTLQ